MSNNHTVIHMVRHGHVHNPDRILYGRLPRFRLSVTGREQARTAGRYMADWPLKAVFSSPMLRARQTATEILTFFPALKLQRSKLLNEVCTVFEGWPSAQVDRHNEGDIYTGADACFEQPVDVFERVAKFCRRVRSQFAGQHIVAVTHGDVITFSVLWAMGWEVAPRNKARLRQAGYAASYPAHASITSFFFRTASAEDRPAIEYSAPWR
jgi:broad specificity phosphatase PhoE